MSALTLKLFAVFETAPEIPDNMAILKHGCETISDSLDKVVNTESPTFPRTALLALAICGFPCLLNHLPPERFDLLVSLASELEEIASAALTVNRPFYKAIYMLRRKGVL